MADFRDFYVRWLGHPKYNDNNIIIDDATEVIVNKIEMVLFANKGEFIADLDFGCDLEFYLWQTKVNTDFIKQEIIRQLNKYVSELNRTNWTIEVNLVPGVLQDILLIDVFVNDLEIRAIFQ
jgi:hypothetical protein